MSELTIDPNDPDLSWGADKEKVPQQKKYLILPPEELDKEYVRPVRQTYVHTKCGTATTMSLAIAQTYARNPRFYGATYCVHCQMHLPVDEFIWEGTDEKVGS